LKLDLRQKAELETATRTRAARLPKGLRGLWHRITGQYQDVRRQNEREAKTQKTRQANERQNLVESQLQERQPLQAKFKALRTRQAEQLLALRRDISHFQNLDREGVSLRSSLQLTR